MKNALKIIGKKILKCGKIIIHKFKCSISIPIGPARLNLNPSSCSALVFFC